VQALTFALGTSRILICLFSAMSLMMAVAIFFLEIPLLLQMGGIFFLYWQGKRTINTHARKMTGEAITYLWRDSKGRWGYQTQAGFRAIGALQGDSFRSQWLLILHIRLKTGSIQILVPRDAVSEAEYRLLSTAMILN
jgi:hypothetical protein